MSKIPLLLAAFLVALAGVTHAADDSAKPAKKSSLAASANSQLRLDDVPSVRTDPNSAQPLNARRTSTPSNQRTRQNETGLATE